MFVVLSFIFIALLCIYEDITKYGRFGRYVNKIPGPFAWPIVGALPDLIFPRFPTPETIWTILQSYSTKYYPICRFSSFSKVVLFIYHPDDLETILTSNKHTDKSVLYKPLFGWLRTGLLTSQGAKWQKRRKMLTPAFHFSVLQQYFKSIAENGEKTMESLMSKGEAVYDVSDLVTDYTLKVICETAMGYKFTDQSFLRKYREAIHFVGACLMYRVFCPWFLPDFTFRLTERGQKYEKALDTLHSFTKRIIKERKDFHEETNGCFLKEFMQSESDEESVTEVEYYGGRKKRMAMLDLLIAAQRNGEKISDKGIQEEVDTFTFEGHDTSAAALTFAILLFAEHKHVQDCIRAEVSDVLDRSNGKMSINELSRFNYLEMCLKESLRLYPPVQFLSRDVPEDLQLTNYLIPKGALMVMNTYSTHRIPEFWPDPEKFDPERFSIENSGKRHPFSYIPFSAGFRNCIGQKFAMMELKAFVAHLIYNFHLEPIDIAEDVPLMADIVIRPSRPVRVKLMPIEK